MWNLLLCIVGLLLCSCGPQGAAGVTRDHDLYGLTVSQRLFAVDRSASPAFVSMSPFSRVYNASDARPLFSPVVVDDSNRIWRFAKWANESMTLQAKEPLSGTIVMNVSFANSSIVHSLHRSSGCIHVLTVDNTTSGSVGPSRSLMLRTIQTSSGVVDICKPVGIAGSLVMGPSALDPAANELVIFTRVGPSVLGNRINLANCSVVPFLACNSCDVLSVMANNGESCFSFRNTSSSLVSLQCVSSALPKPAVELWPSSSSWAVDITSSSSMFEGRLTDSSVASVGHHAFSFLDGSHRNVSILSFYLNLSLAQQLPTLSPSNVQLVSDSVDVTFFAAPRPSIKGPYFIPQNSSSTVVLNAPFFWNVSSRGCVEGVDVAYASFPAVNTMELLFMASKVAVPVAAVISQSLPVFQTKVGLSLFGSAFSAFAPETVTWYQPSSNFTSSPLTAGIGVMTTFSVSGVAPGLPTHFARVTFSTISQISFEYSLSANTTSQGDLLLNVRPLLSPSSVLNFSQALVNVSIELGQSQADDVTFSFVVIQPISVTFICPDEQFVNNPVDAIIVKGANFYNSPLLQCIFTLPSGASVTSTAEYVSKLLVLCTNVPTAQTLGGAAQALLSVSNNGQELSQPLPFVFYDSERQAVAVSLPGGAPLSRADNDGNALRPPGTYQLLDSNGNIVTATRTDVRVSISVTPPDPWLQISGNLESRIVEDDPPTYAFPLFYIIGQRGATYNLSLSLTIISTGEVLSTVAFGSIHILSCSERGKFQVNPSEDPRLCVCKPGFKYVGYGQACIPCGSREYKSTSANTLCDVCPPDSEVLSVNATHVSACKCSAGFVNVQPVEFLADAGAAPTCQICPPGSFCQNVGLDRNSIPSAPGYWRSASPDLQFYQCISLGCRGGIADSVCDDGYEGVLCGDCSIGYMRVGIQCVSCPGTGGSWFIVFLMVIISLALITVLGIVLGSRSQRTTVLLKILMVHVQSVGIFSHFAFQWSPFLNGAFGWLSIIVMDSKSLASAGRCTREDEWSTSYAFALTWFLQVFIYAIIAITATIVVRNVLYHFGRKNRNAKGRKKLRSAFSMGSSKEFDKPVSDVGYILKYHFRVVIVVCWLMCPIVVLVALFALPCVDVEGSSYLIDAASVKCGSAAHVAGVVWGVLILFFFSLGWPMFAWLKLRRPEVEKDHLSCENRAYTFLGALRTLYVAGMTERFWWFDFLLYARQLLLVIFAVLSRSVVFSGPEGAILMFDGATKLTITLLVLFLGFITFYYPYAEPLYNYLQTLSTVLLVITLLIGSLISAPSSYPALKDGFSALLLMAHLLFIIIGFALIAKSAVALFAALLQRRRVSTKSSTLHHALIDRNEL